MGCKHKKVGIDFYEQTCYCLNEDCGQIIGDDETITLTKAQYQRILDALKALELYMSDYFPESNHFAGDVDMNSRRKNLYEKFDALDKGE